MNKVGQSIPRLDWEDADDLTGEAVITASSEMELSQLEGNGEWQKLTFSTAQLLPLEAKTNYCFKLKVKASKDTTLDVVFKTSSSQKHYTPDVILEKQQFELSAGEQEIEVNSHFELEEDKYVYLAFMQNENVEVALSDQLLTGVMTVQNRINKAVSNFGKQEPAEGLGLDAFEFWTPERRPAGKNLALNIEPAITNFAAENVENNEIRPTSNAQSNAWVADFNDEKPELTLSWDSPQNIKKIVLFFDADYDHALECNLMQHPESELPFTVGTYEIRNDKGDVVHSTEENYQAINTILFDDMVVTDKLRFVFAKKLENVPVSLFKVCVSEEA